MKFWHWQGLYVCLWCGAITVGMSNGYLIAWDLSSSQTQVRCTETPLYLFLSGNPLPSNHHSCWGEPLRACTWFVTSAASHSVTGALHSGKYLRPHQNLSTWGTAQSEQVPTHNSGLWREELGVTVVGDQVHSGALFWHGTSIITLKTVLSVWCLMMRLHILSMR